MVQKHDCGFQFHYWRLLGYLHLLLASQSPMDEARCGEAKRVVWLGASNSAGWSYVLLTGMHLPPPLNLSVTGSCHLWFENARKHSRVRIPGIEAE